MDDTILVVGIGNVLWADEGFGVRAVEALHRAWRFPPRVRLMDGGTQGLYLLDAVKSCRRLIVFDAIDFGLPPGTLKVARDEEVPAWGATKMSLHQAGFQEVLAVARLSGSYPDALALIGVQPVELKDFGGSLREPVKARIPEAVGIACDLLRQWGVEAEPRSALPAAEEGLNWQALDMDQYESGRPGEDLACRTGDPRFLRPPGESR